MHLYIARNGKQPEPHDEQEIREMVSSGKILRNQFAWREGDPDWVPLDQLIQFDELESPALPRGLPPIPAAHEIPPQSTSTQVKSLKPNENLGPANVAKPQLSERVVAGLIGGVLILIGIGVITGFFGKPNVWWGGLACFLGAKLLQGTKTKW